MQSHVGETGALSERTCWQCGTELDALLVFPAAAGLSSVVFFRCPNCRQISMRRRRVDSEPATFSRSAP